MKQQTILTLFLSSMILTGCDLEKKNGQAGVVRFAAYQQSSEGRVATKGTGTNFDAGDEITIFAPLAGNAIHGTYDQAVSKAGKDMRYLADNSNRFSAKNEEDKIRYSSSSVKLDFYAVYPAVGPKPKCATVDNTTYEIDLGDISRQDGTTDRLEPYIYSNNAKGKGVGDGVVTLAFRNVFSKIVVKVRYDELSLDGKMLSKVEFSAEDGLYRECVIDLKRGDYTKVATNGGRDDKLATKEDPYSFPVPNEVEWTSDGTWSTGMTEGYFVPGQTTNPVIRLTFGEDTPTVNIGTGDGTVTTGTQTFLCRIPTTGTGGRVTFEPGKMYTYTVEVNGTMPEVTMGGTIEDWQAAGGVTEIFAE